MSGYNKYFLLNNDVELPILGIKSQQLHFSSFSLSDFNLDYKNFSLLQSPIRKFPIYTAANIDGNKFYKIKRSLLFNGSDKWQKDNRISENHQFGKELYKANQSDFDRGHMTKREDVQWGNSFEDAKEAAKSTFFYTNSIPQMAKLNRGIWKDIEDYVLHEETLNNDLKITLFTGPVLGSNDPKFVTEVNNKDVQIPYLFWKVIYYTHEDVLLRTSFIAGQRNQLILKGIIEDEYRDDETAIKFQSFKDAVTYQVKTEFIEEITGMKFTNAIEKYTDNRATELILEETDVRNEATDVPVIINITL